MKKLLVVVLAMAVALSFGSMAMAKNGLSLEFGLGYNPNMADMGKAILKDGEDGGADDTYSGTIFKKAILAQNELEIAKNDATKSSLITKVKTDVSAMSSLNVGLNARYDILNKFFAKIGFNYDVVFGTEQQFTLASNANAVMYGLASMSGGNYLNVANTTWAGATSLNNAKVSQKWEAGCWAIPVTIGINVPINDGKYNIYAGLGLTYYSGYWAITVKGPANYVVSNSALTAAYSEKVKFEASGIGMNYLIGADAEVYDNLAVFIEYTVTYAGGMSDSVDLKAPALKAAMGVDNMVYPVNLSSALFKFGVKYNFGLATL